jgi:hypothetical protein
MAAEEQREIIMVYDSEIREEEKSLKPQKDDMC